MYLLIMSNSMPIKEEKEQELESSSSCSLSQENVVVVVVSSKIEGHNDDDDDGYHTPTSPRHRIPAVMECPPAPKKPSLRRYKKRKACCAIEIKDVELVFCAEMDEGKRSKKAREEVASNE